MLSVFLTPDLSVSSPLSPPGFLKPGTGGPVPLSLQARPQPFMFPSVEKAGQSGNQGKVMGSSATPTKIG